jgi:Helix-turn-helix domain
MDRAVEKLLYSRRDTAEALSLSIRSIDYLITAGRLPVRRVGGKILIPASAVRRFAREDHPDCVRAVAPDASQHPTSGRRFSRPFARRFQPQSEELDDPARVKINGTE